MLWETKRCPGNSLALQWLRLSAFTAVGLAWGTKIPQASWHGQKKKELSCSVPFTAWTFRQATGDFSFAVLKESAVDLGRAVIAL